MVGVTTSQTSDTPGLSPAVHKFLRALASETRQRVMLLFASGGEHTVGAVAELTGIAQSTASEQLAQLRDGGLITSRREGKTVYYRADQAAILATLGELSSFLRSCCSSE